MVTFPSCSRHTLSFPSSRSCTDTGGQGAAGATDWGRAPHKSLSGCSGNHKEEAGHNCPNLFILPKVTLALYHLAASCTITSMEFRLPGS